MHVISKKKVIDFAKRHPNAASPLFSWYKIVNLNNFHNFNELRNLLPSADQVGKYTVFNIGGNNYRLIAVIHYNRTKLYIREILTHSEYDSEKWKEK